MGGRSWAPAGCERVSSGVRVETQLRPGTAQDIPAVAAIECASFGDPWSEASFHELLRIGGAIFLVATRGPAQIVAGYVVALVAADEAEVLNLAVSPVERRHGLGGELLDAGMTAVRSRGAQQIFLEVRESNAAALALYASRGFSELSRRRKYYLNPVEDALVLRRAIEG